MSQQNRWKHLRDTPYLGFIDPDNDSPLLRQCVNKYVLPFYKGLTVDCTTPRFIAACAEITSNEAVLLLRNRCWRTCMMVAHFIAIRKLCETQQELSSVFLKGEIYFFGRHSCAASARFGNQTAIETLCCFIHSDVKFDKEMAIAALMHLGVKPSSELDAKWIEPYKVMESRERETLRYSFSWMRHHLAMIEKAEQMLCDAPR